MSVTKFLNNRAHKLVPTANILAVIVEGVCFLNYVFDLNVLFCAPQPIFFHFQPTEIQNSNFTFPHFPRHFGRLEENPVSEPRGREHGQFVEHLKQLPRLAERARRGGYEPWPGLPPCLHIFHLVPKQSKRPRGHS